MKKILTIAGSDCSGGAGIQADIKTITAHKMYAMSAITALTAQNTTGVFGILDVGIELIAQQIDCIFNDIRPDAIKIGMVSSNEIIKTIAQKLQEYDAKNVVIDPVMVSASGSKLLADSAIEILKTTLLPLGNIITPNIFEAEILSNTSIKNKDDMIKAAKIIAEKTNPVVLLKGGHSVCDGTDLLFDNGNINWIESKKIETENTHGTGCTLSSAIACNMAQGLELSDCVLMAKKYLSGALNDGLNLGKGRGPLNHVYNL